ncbi:MAG: hypothetical protein U0T73_11655 [Chitinophagales bacterium]
MKKILFVLVLSLAIQETNAQFVSRLDITENIPGLCDKNETYALFNAFKGQEQAKCPITKEAILARLNKELPFFKSHPELNDKGEVTLMINCKGEVIQCKMEKKFENEALNTQVLAIFNSLGIWLPGKLNGREVDSSELYRLKIKDGKVTFR